MSVITYKCPNCGGGLIFDPATQNYRCEYCLSKFTQEELDRTAVKEESRPEPESAAAQPEDPGGAVLYRCPNCGAEIVTDETTSASICYYCHNPVVLEGKLKGGYHPDYVIPFAVSKEQASQIFMQWVRRKGYLPRGFHSKKRLDSITGVYFPYWLYNCQADGTVEGTGIKTKTCMNGNLRYTETEKYHINRFGRMAVSKVTRNALKKANKKLVEGVLPFDMSNLRPFTSGYLSGFLAENRDMENKEFEEEVRYEVRQMTEEELRQDIWGYSAVSLQRAQVRLEDEKWEYALLPVWIMTYSSGGNIYHFACNGQSGKVCGELPVNRFKITLLFAGVFLPILAFLLCVGYLI